MTERAPFSFLYVSDLHVTLAGVPLL